MRTVLWWGRFDANYSRNRVLRELLPELGWRVVDFHPLFGGLADWEARFKQLPNPDLVWLPCFRQRDLAAASRWARSNRVPLLFDPLISAYDKQVFERGKIPPDSAKARRLLAWETDLFQRADSVLADTEEHARYFRETFQVASERVHVVYVGAEEGLFAPGEQLQKAPGEALEALFYGSFIPLQGAPVIVEAARRYAGPLVRWTLIGSGPELAQCKRAAMGLSNVTFEPWVDYSALPARIRRADILLGVFGTTHKAGRVIPNKVYQALACGKPVVTRKSEAYPESVRGAFEQGLNWVEPGDPADLAETVAHLAQNRLLESNLGRAAFDLYAKHFSNRIILMQLRQALASIQGLPNR
jgi:glycosyltransferase involved in cell wall biosynthesis